MKKTISAEIVEIIRTKTVVGEGTEKDPVRTEVQYWEKDGRVISKNYLEESKD